MRFLALATLVVVACTGDEPEEVGFSTGTRPMTGVDAASSGGTSGEVPTTGAAESTGEASDATVAGTSSGETGETGVADTGETGEGTTEAGTTGDDGVVSVVVDPAGGHEVQVGMLGGLTATALDGHGQPVPDAAITWRSSDGLVVYVDGVGGLLGVSQGGATVTAEADGVVSAPVAIAVVGFVPPAATFSEVLAIANTGCAVAGCHVDGVEAGDLRWDRGPKSTWDKLVEEEADGAPGWMRIQPGEPRQSYVLHKLALGEPEAGARMPFGGPPLAAAEAQVFVRWILDGAPLN
jgi:hypothetical protein